MTKKRAYQLTLEVYEDGEWQLNERRLTVMVDADEEGLEGAIDRALAIVADEVGDADAGSYRVQEAELLAEGYE